MKSSLKYSLIACVVTVAASTNVLAEGVEELVGDGFDLVGDIAGGVPGALIDGGNDIARTIKGTTTIKGKVETKVEVQDITQEITSGTGSVNDLNVGSVGGGAFIDGDFKSDVKAGLITQSISGDNNVNRANLGSVTN
jgi:hypothetical protein